MSSSKPRAKVRVSADIGGTFTDIVLASETGTIFTSKVPSTPDAPERAVIEGVAAILEAAGARGEDVLEVLHGTTIGSNALLEKTGAATGLITTKGFRDILEIGRVRTPDLFDLTWSKPVPLIERWARLEVRERMTADGSVLEPLSEDDVRAAGARFAEMGVTSIAVCYINSYRNSDHERRTREILAEVFPQFSVTLSTDIQPEAKEYERTSTAAVNAYVLPVMRRYFDRLASGLHDVGIAASLYVVNSSGGLSHAKLAASKPVFFISSGPAAGVTGAARLGSSIGADNLIVFDMGGTTAKAALIEDGRISRTNEYEFRAGISTPSRFIKAGGYLMRAPTIDIAEVGAGAGSIATVDAGGLIHVGPRSAGAVPGPACYGLGGHEATVTDANLVLGLLNPQALAGGTLAVDRDKAVQAVHEHLAQRLNASVEDAAIGVRAVVNAGMARAIRAVTIERGVDPRDFQLVAFGGSGPVHACDVARLLGIRRIVLPNMAGVFTAAGMLAGDVEREFVEPLAGLLDNGAGNDIAAAIGRLEGEAREALADDGFDSDDIALESSVDLRFESQDTNLTVLTGNLTGPNFVTDLRERFLQDYERIYEYRASDGIELVTARIVGIGRRAGKLDFRSYRLDDAAGAATKSTDRPVMFSRESGWTSTPVVARRDLNGGMHGPVIVESSDTTVVVPPDARLTTDGVGNLFVVMETP